MPDGDKRTPPLSVEDGDYYVERGLFVFTAAYHLKRGYCCESGCRHCPYGYAPQEMRGKSPAEPEE